MTSIKVIKKGITRKIHIDDTSSWEGFTERLSNVFSVATESLELTYVDCDNDVIMLSTITELQEAINDGVKTFCLSSQVSN
jgi:PB1 domain